MLYAFLALSPILLALAAMVTSIADEIASNPQYVAQYALSYEEFLSAATRLTTLFLGVGGILVPLMLIGVFLFLYGEKGRRLRDFVEILPFGLFAGAAFCLPYYLISVVGGHEFPSILGAVIGLSLSVLAAAHGFLVPRHVWRFPDDPLEDPVRSVNQARAMPAWRGWLPYACVGLFLFVSRVDVFGLKGLLQSVTVGWSGLFGVDACSFSFQPFWKPGLLPFGLFAVVLGLVSGIGVKDAGRVCLGSFFQLLKVFSALVFGVAMVQIMLNSGVNSSGMDSMLMVAAQALADLTGSAFPIISPSLGCWGPSSPAPAPSPASCLPLSSSTPLCSSEWTRSTPAPSSAPVVRWAT